jgi:hypothetical protein
MLLHTLDESGMNMKAIAVALGVLIWLSVSPAWATQQHGAPEGLYVHQVAHLFFALAMGLLIYWLHKWRLAGSAGWRYIRYAAYFFIAWNIDAMLSHWLEEESVWIQAERIGRMQITITTAEGFDWLAILFYISKLDHLLCVPALLFLFLGLRRLLDTLPESDTVQEPAP